MTTSQLTREDLERMYWGEKKNQYQIARELGCAQTTISEWMKKFGISRRPMSEVFHNYVKVNVNPSENLAYVLGVLKGDGYVYEKGGVVRLEQIHQEFAKSFEVALKYLGFNSRTIIRKRQTFKQGFCYFTYASSISFVQWYKQLSLEDIEKILSDNPEFIKAFVRGFFESEGCNYLHSRYRNRGIYVDWNISIYNTNKELLKLVERLLAKLNFKFRLGFQVERAKRKICFVLRSGIQQQNYHFIREIKPCIKNRVIENPVHPREKWTKEKISYTFKKFVETNGFSPSYRQIPIKLRSSAIYHFGTLNEAKKAIGIEIYPIGYNKKPLEARMAL